MSTEFLVGSIKKMTEETKQNVSDVTCSGYQNFIRTFLCLDQRDSLEGFQDKESITKHWGKMMKQVWSIKSLHIKINKKKNV